MKKILMLALLLVALGMPVSAAAEAFTWDVDPAHTNVYFDIKHIYSTVRGSFSEFSGAVNFDPENPGASKVDFTIQAKSINTGIGKRDGHLRGPDFFDVGKFPTIHFKSESIVKKEDGVFEAVGVLTVKDVSKKVTLPLYFLGVRDAMEPGKVVAGLDSRFTIDRLEYNVGTGKFLKMGVVGKDVEVLVTLEVLREK